MRRIITKANMLFIYIFLYIITTGIIYFIIFPDELTRVNGGGSPAVVDGSVITIVNIMISMILIKFVWSMVLLVSAPWYELKKKKREKEFSAVSFNPKVTVIVPAYNEEVGVLSTIKTILDSTYKNMELIVVNDGSTDNSDSLIRNFKSEYESNQKVNDPEFRYFYKENGGKGKALNFALARSKGDIIITVDGDCVLLPNTVENFVKHFVNPEIDGVVGNVKIAKTGSFISSLQALEFLNSFYTKKGEDILGVIYIVGGAAAAFTREGFRKVGFYDHANITEDIDLSVRIRKKGMNISYADDAVIYTEGASDMKGLIKQRTRWKTGWFQTMQSHTNMFFSRDRDHHKVLTWTTLPLVYLGNIQLLFEMLFIVFIYVYTYLNQDFSPFITWIGLVVVMMSSLMIVERKDLKLPSLFSIPIAWILFQVMIYVEYRALLTTVWKGIRKQELKWQKWDRVGISIKK